MITVKTTVEISLLIFVFVILRIILYGLCDMLFYFFDSLYEKVSERISGKKLTREQESHAL